MIDSRHLMPVKIAILISSFFLVAVIFFVGGDDSEDEFLNLFDGETLDGWHIMNGAKFTVEEGVIKLNGGSGWLRSDKQYSDFNLRIEFRFKIPKQDGGVFLRSSLEGENWPDRNYEVQVENTLRMAKIWGAEHDLNVNLVRISLKPINEWNEYDIKLVGSKVEVRLNGKLVTTSNRMDELTRGYIGLQGENGLHEYRNIRIRDLSN